MCVCLGGATLPTTGTGRRLTGSRRVARLGDRHPGRVGDPPDREGYSLASVGPKPRQSRELRSHLMQICLMIDSQEDVTREDGVGELNVITQLGRQVAPAGA